MGWLKVFKPNLLVVAHRARVLVPRIHLLQLLKPHVVETLDRVVASAERGAMSYVGFDVVVAIMLEIVTTETKTKTDMVDAPVAVAVAVVVAEVAEAEAVACFVVAIKVVTTMRRIRTYKVHSTMPQILLMVAMELQVNHRHIMTKNNLQKQTCTTVTPSRLRTETCPKVKAVELDLLVDRDHQASMVSWQR